MYVLTCRNVSHIWHICQALHADKEHQQTLGGFSFHPHPVGDVDTHVLGSTSAQLGVCVSALKRISLTLNPNAYTAGVVDTHVLGSACAEEESTPLPFRRYASDNRT